jgi:hypothetical protein
MHAFFDRCSLPRSTYHKFQPKTLVTKLILNHKNKTNKEMEKNKEVNLNVSHMH